MTPPAHIVDSTVCLAGQTFVLRRLIAGHQSGKNARFVRRHPARSGEERARLGRGNAALTMRSHTLRPRTLAG